MQFGVERPGQQLEALATLEEAAFVREVTERRPRSAGPLTPAEVAALREAYAEHAGPVRAAEAEKQRLEQRLAGLVNAAYGLTPQEVALLWRTAPPRMPVGPPEGKT